MKCTAECPFVLDVDHQGKDIQHMLDIGLKWASAVCTPYPYAKDGLLSNKLRWLRAGEMEIISISPQSKASIVAGSILAEKQHAMVM